MLMNPQVFVVKTVLLSKNSGEKAVHSIPQNRSRFQLVMAGAILYQLKILRKPIV